MQWQCGIMFLAIFSTKGGRPRPPTVGERGPNLFHFWEFSFTFRRSSEFTRCLIITTAPTSNQFFFWLVCDSCAAISLDLNTSKTSILRVVRKRFLDRLFQMARRASWNNPKCTKYQKGVKKHPACFNRCPAGLINRESWLKCEKSWRKNLGKLKLSGEPLKKHHKSTLRKVTHTF